MFHDQMPFPPHEGLPFLSGPPTVDAFFEQEPGVTTTQLDAGYVNGGRYTYGAEAGIPRAVFQGIKHNTNGDVYMAFVARHDPGFDEDDFVMIVLRPSFGAPPSAEDRRIDIQPSEGAGGALPNPPDPEGNDQPDPPNPGALPQVKTNKPAATTTFYKRDPGGSLTWKKDVPQASVDVKVRTADAGGGSLFWSVEVRITPSTWLTLQPEFGLFFDIGQVIVPGSGLQNLTQYPWPFDPAVPKANFLIDKPAWGGLKANWDPTTIGKGILLKPGDPNPAPGVRFKNGASGIGVLSGGNVGSTVDLAVGASNEFVAQLQNSSPTEAPGVTAKFRIAEFGISGGLYGDILGLEALWEELPAVPNPAPVGGLPIPTTVMPSDHTDIVTTWTVSPADHDKFHPPGQAALWDDQCVWVQLDSVVGGVAFAQESVRRNLHLINLSEAKHPAVLNGKFFPKPPDGDRHDLLLHVTRTLIPPAKPGPTPLDILYREAGECGHVPLLEDNPLTNGTAGVEDPKEPTATWHTVVHAYEYIPDTLTFDGTVRQNLVLAGSYAYVARHALENGEEHGSVTIRHELGADGADLEPLGKHFYRLTIGHDERVVLYNELAAVPKGYGTDDPGGSGSSA